jgi:hypothetical protein
MTGRVFLDLFDENLRTIPFERTDLFKVRQLDFNRLSRTKTRFANDPHEAGKRVVL